MTHKHQFILIEQVTKPRPNMHNGTTVSPRFEHIYGAKAGCILCGQVKTVWEDGATETLATGDKAYDDNPKQG